MRTAFIAELLALADQNADMWLVTGDLGYSVLEPFAARFPSRFVNAGVAEQNMIGIAAGLAHSGATVFVYSIANFPTFRCLEQIRNDIAYPGVSVTIVSVGSGFSYGSHGSTHHAIEDLAVMRSLPGMTVVSPADPTETTLATRELARLRGPAYLRLGKAGESVIKAAKDEGFQLGRMRLVRSGTDVTIIAIGSIVANAALAADALSEEGISVRVYSSHTLKPFDASTLLHAMSETAGLVTVEEHRLVGGLRAAIAEALLEVPQRRGVPIRSLGIAADAIFGTGDQTYLRDSCGLGAHQIADAIRSLLASTSTRV